MKNKINFYTDFNLDILRKLLFIKYKIYSLSDSFIPERIHFKKPSSKRNETCIIWFSLESFKNTYLQSGQINEESIFINLDKKIYEFADELINISKFYERTIVFSFISNKQFKKNPLTSYGGNGDSLIATKLNLVLAQKIIEIPGIYLIDTQILISNTNNPFDMKNWYLTKNPFTLNFIKVVVKEITNILKTLSGEQKIKLILLDLDNTIWGGEAGENEISSIRLGGHDAIGESFLDFQKSLVSMNKKGILIALTSKNYEEIAMNVFDNHPDMVLKREHIVAKRINWEPKYLNIISIMEELKLGLESALFIDDNPIERESIKFNLPEINILELPKYPYYYSQSLESLSSLHLIERTNEDNMRTLSYQQNRHRFSEKEKNNKDTWLKELETKVKISQIKSKNIMRYVQLLNKTNQFNVKTRRMTNPEFESWISFAGNKAYTIRLEDKFGDLGIIGLLGYKFTDKKLYIEDFVLSCRAAGRGIEDLMLYQIYKEAKSNNINEIEIEAIKTEKNMPIINFLSNSPFLENIGGNHYLVNTKNVNIKIPKYISIIDDI